MGRLFKGEKQLSPLVTISENSLRASCPSFDEMGAKKPDQTILVDQGKAGSPLVSNRSSIEYGLNSTAAMSGESPESIDMKAGDLAENDVLDALGTGLYINNLWYLNYSDLREGVITGMTRFACFWVEEGQIVGPTNVMRFDDSVYRLLGDGLEALTAERQLLFDPGSYDQRSTSSMHLPGALINDMNFTL